MASRRGSKRLRSVLVEEERDRTHIAGQVELE